MIKFEGPLIAVNDIARSRHFYEQVLSQKVKFDFGENVTYEGNLSIHRKAHFQQLLGESTCYTVVTKAHNGELYFETDEIEAVLVKLKNNSVEFVHDLKEQPWGQRGIRFYDPDGHVIEIGEPMETVVQRLYKDGLSAQEICKKSGMPADFVEGVVGIVQEQK